jgi:integrase
MKMALPRGMFRRGGKLWARKDVPKPLREIVGQTSLQQTLGTSDVNRARVLFHDVMRRFEARIADARARLENQPTGSNPYMLTIPLEHFGVSPEMEEAYREYLAMKPENQMRETAQRMERNLVEAGLVRATPEAVSMEDLFQRWIKEREPAPNSKNEYQRAKDLFVRLNTDKPIAEYTSTDARKYKDHVLEMNGPNGKPLAHGTRVKWFSSVKTLFTLADANDLLAQNPFTKITLQKLNRSKRSRREDWDIEELKTLFASPVYADHKRPKGGAGEASYWLPVLALYHGFRAGELCQLDKPDVVKRSGIWCLSIRPSDEDEAKSVKTDSSIRVVPLHSTVIALGFLDYVASVKGKKLFPKMKPDSIGRWAGSWSKWFGRYRHEIGLGGRWRDFHSLRGTWKTAARGARIDEEIHDEISGHDNGSVGRGYGKVPIPLLKAELDKIEFDVEIPKWKSRA